MRRIITLAVLLAAGLTTMGQVKGYQCTYQEKLNLNGQLEKMDGVENAGEIMDAISSFLQKRKSYYTLTFADGKSLFEKNTAISDDDFGMGNMVPVIYVDFGKQEQTAQYNFYGRNFYVVDSLKQNEWAFGNESREICGMHCTKATLTTDSMTADVWFSAETPIPAGPQYFYGLPGLVVEVSMGPVTYTLTEIKALDKESKLKQPTKGKKVTDEEFKAIVEEKMKSMNFGGGSNDEHTFIIRN